MARILIIDHDENNCGRFSSMISQMGQNPSCAPTLGEGLRKISVEAFDVVLINAQMPDGNGLDLIPKIKSNGNSPEVIITSSVGNPDEAEQSIANGAWDYIVKTASPDAIQLNISRALQYRSERSNGKPPFALKRKEIIGCSHRLNVSFEHLAQAAQSDVNVLITGESGTGKELFARAIHNNSSRAGKSFVIVDCTALPETLVESVLFGHTRGAFTGAYNSQEGLIKHADQGTIFLDEIGELPLSIQKSFLRVIQEHRFRPIGGKNEIDSDFRLVAATNRNLDNMVRQGQFREDLLFRIRTLVIELPPLRECVGDIKELTLHYVNHLCSHFGIPKKDFSPEFWNIMLNYKWPGNVRELIQAMEKALLSAKDDPVLFPKHLPLHIRIRIARESANSNSENHTADNSDTTGHVVSGTTPILPRLKEIREAAIYEAENRYFKELIASTRGNIEEAIRISGVSRSRFYTLLKKYR